MEKTYSAIDSPVTSDNNEEMNQTLLPEFLNSLNPQSLPQFKLRLRQYAILMLTRNFNISEGLCNGTRLLILDLRNNFLKCRILTGDKSGNITFIHRITLYPDNDYPFTFSRRQFPIKLAFAMTINKAQGQTFESIGFDLEKDVFTHGQMYVALSRVKSWDSLKIFISLEERKNEGFKNIVFKELFNR